MAENGCLTLAASGTEVMSEFTADRTVSEGQVGHMPQQSFPMTYSFGSDNSPSGKDSQGIDPRCMQGCKRKNAHPSIICYSHTLEMI